MYPNIPPTATRPLVMHDEQRQALIPPGYAPPSGGCTRPSCVCVFCVCAMLGVAATIAVPLVVMTNAHRKVLTHSLSAGILGKTAARPPPDAADGPPSVPMAAQELKQAQAPQEAPQEARSDRSPPPAPQPLALHLQHRPAAVPVEGKGAARKYSHVLTNATTENPLP